MEAEEALKLYERLMFLGEDLFVDGNLQVDGKILPLTEDAVYKTLNYIARDQYEQVKEHIESGADGLDVMGALVMCCVEFGMLLERELAQERGVDE